MNNQPTPEEIEEVIPPDAEAILHPGHVAPRWSGAVWSDKALEWFVGAAIVAELVVILLNILVRLFTGDSLLWTQEVSEIALLTIAFIGGAIAYPKGAHMSVEALVMRLPSSWKPYLAALVDWLVFTMSAGAFVLFVPTLVQQIDDLMSGLGESPMLFMIFTIVLLVIMGQLLEGLPAVLIFAPLLLPIAVEFGVNPVQYAMVLIISMGIGSFAPPAGVGFYVACATGLETVERSLKHFWPYLIAVFLGLLVLAAVPWFSTILPALAGLIPF